MDTRAIVGIIWYMRAVDVRNGRIRVALPFKTARSVRSDAVLSLSKE